MIIKLSIVYLFVCFPFLFRPWVRNLCDFDHV